MSKDEIYDHFLLTMQDNLKEIDSIIEKGNKISDADKETLKRIFHSFKGNLVALHFNKEFINSFGKKMLIDLEKFEFQNLSETIEDFKTRVNKELFLKN